MFQCSQSHQPPKLFFLQWRKRQKCDVCFSCFSSPPALSISVYHSCSDTVNNTIKQTTKTKSFHAVQLPPPLPGTLMANFLLRLTKLNKNCMDSSVMTIYHPPTQTLLYIHTNTLTGLTAALGTGDRCLGFWEPDTHTQVLIRQTKVCAEGAGSDAATSGPPLPRYNRVSVPARSFHLSISHRASEDLQTRQKVDWVNANKLSGAVLLCFNQVNPFDGHLGASPGQLLSTWLGKDGNLQSCQVYFQ